MHFSGGGEGEFSAVGIFNEDNLPLGGKFPGSDFSRENFHLRN